MSLHHPCIIACIFALIYKTNETGNHKNKHSKIPWSSKLHDNLKLYWSCSTETCLKRFLFLACNGMMMHSAPPKGIIVLSLPLEGTYVADRLCNYLWQRATVYDKSPHNIPRAFTLRLESQCSLNPSDNTTWVTARHDPDSVRALWNLWYLVVTGSIMYP